MAIYHLSAHIISRGSGRSVVAAAAYRAAEKLQDHRLGKAMDFSRKSGVEHKEILAPANAPTWVHDRERLWNEVEKSEKRKDAQLAREVRVALPKELDAKAQVELVRAYCLEQFVGRGMIADISIHRDDPNNPHAHILLTMREICNDGGHGSVARVGEADPPEDASRTKDASRSEDSSRWRPNGFGQKVRAWNDRELLHRFREEWAHSVNRQLERDGFDIHVDHRSYEAQGIALEPGIKIGSSHKIVGRDGREVIRDRLIDQESIARRNGEAIAETPELALEALTRQHATFTRRDVGRWLNGRTADAEQFQQCFDRVLGSKELVAIGDDARGETRFTTREMLATEQAMFHVAEKLEGRSAHQVEARFIEQAETTRALSEEQKIALRHVIERPSDIAIVEGYAGTGKSYVFGAAREALEAQGLRVLGAALAGKAAEGFEISTGIPSRSLASFEYAWRGGRDKLTGRDVLVIDEAGMVGTRQMERVLGEAERAGAKVILVGDTEQLQAIEAGAAFRGLSGACGQVTLSGIRRQESEAHRAATRYLAEGRTLEALRVYRGEDRVHGYGTRAQATKSVIQAWDRDRKAHPGGSQLMLAYRRTDVRALNDQAREIRRQAGELGKDSRIETARGARDFARKDRIVFLQNDRHLGVKNGSMGTVAKVKDTAMTVILDDGQNVAFDAREYPNIDHGYAATVHKAQGLTVDRAYVLASEHFDRHVTYVALSRHRKEVDLYWAKADFADGKTAAQTLSRPRPKDLTVDYRKVAELIRPAQPVQPTRVQTREVGTSIPQTRTTRSVEPAPTATAAEVARKYKSLWLETLEKSKTAEEMFQGFEPVKKAHRLREGASFFASQSREAREQFERMHPIRAAVARRGIGPDAKIYEAERTALGGFEKARGALQELERDQALRDRAGREAGQHNERLSHAASELRALKPTYERAKRELEQRREIRAQEITHERGRGRGRGDGFER